jgi:hypothetical protein
MMKLRKFSTIAFAMFAMASTMSVAEARSRSFHHSVQGLDGRGYQHSYHMVRGGGQGAMNHNVQTNGGRGLTIQRSYRTQDGQFNGQTSYVTNGGKSWGRSTSATANGDGTANYDRTLTGPGGRTVTRSGTVGY